MKKYRIVELNNGTYDLEIKRRCYADIFRSWDKWANYKTYDSAYKKMEEFITDDEDIKKYKNGLKRKKIWMVR